MSTAIQRRILNYRADILPAAQRIAALEWPILFDSSGQTGDPLQDVVAALPCARVWVYRTHCLCVDQSQLRHQALDYWPVFVDELLNRYAAEPNDEPGPGWLGFLSYDLGRERQPGRRYRQGDEDTDEPLAALGFYPAIILNKHESATAELRYLSGFEATAQQLADCWNTPETVEIQRFRMTTPFQPDTSRQAYKSAFLRTQEYIRSGDCYQINLTQRFSAPFEGSPIAAYRGLRELHQAPMGGYFDIGDRQILSLSPERLLFGQADRLETHPIKGTIARGKTEQEDSILKRSLALSEKNRAENVMIVDLLRHDLGKICQTGSIRVSRLCELETHPNVHHLVSTVTGLRRTDYSLLTAILSVFPGGSITGAPKIRAMEIIDELEINARSIYCGSLLMLSSGGYLDSNILIRSFLIRHNTIHCWGGGGIVADSDLEDEWQESITKIKTLLQILESASGLKGSD
jgi:para-aminobenzoate synthetase component 1